jgi:hypothetical protein
MYNELDDFDSMVQPEDIQCDNPIDSDFDEWGDMHDADHWDDDDFDGDDVCNEYPYEYDEGSDRDNWEENQVFLDNEF